MEEGEKRYLGVLRRRLRHNNGVSGHRSRSQGLARRCFGGQNLEMCTSVYMPVGADTDIDINNNVHC
jgi:hypothetical protein